MAGAVPSITDIYSLTYSLLLTTNVVSFLHHKRFGYVEMTPPPPPIIAELPASPLPLSYKYNIGKGEEELQCSASAQIEGGGGCFNENYGIPNALLPHLPGKS